MNPQESSTNDESGLGPPAQKSSSRKTNESKSKSEKKSKKKERPKSSPDSEPGEEATESKKKSKKNKRPKSSPEQGPEPGDEAVNPVSQSNEISKVETSSNATSTFTDQENAAARPSDRNKKDSKSNGKIRKDIFGYRSQLYKRKGPIFKVGGMEDEASEDFAGGSNGDGSSGRDMSWLRELSAKPSISQADFEKKNTGQDIHNAMNIYWNFLLFSGRLPLTFQRDSSNQSISCKYNRRGISFIMFLATSIFLMIIAALSLTGFVGIFLLGNNTSSVLTMEDKIAHANLETERLLFEKNWALGLLFVCSAIFVCLASIEIMLNGQRIAEYINDWCETVDNLNYDATSGMKTFAVVFIIASIVEAWIAISVYFGSRNAFVEGIDFIGVIMFRYFSPQLVFLPYRKVLFTIGLLLFIYVMYCARNIIILIVICGIGITNLATEWNFRLRLILQNVNPQALETYLKKLAASLDYDTMFSNHHRIIKLVKQMSVTFGCILISFCIIQGLILVCQLYEVVICVIAQRPSQIMSGSTVYPGNRSDIIQYMEEKDHTNRFAIIVYVIHTFLSFLIVTWKLSGIESTIMEAMFDVRRHEAIPNKSTNKRDFILSLQMSFSSVNSYALRAGRFKIDKSFIFSFFTVVVYLFTVAILSNVQRRVTMPAFYDCDERDINYINDSGYCLGTIDTLPSGVVAVHEENLRFGRRCIKPSNFLSQGFHICNRTNVKRPKIFGRKCKLIPPPEDVVECIFNIYPDIGEATYYDYLGRNLTASPDCPMSINTLQIANYSNSCWSPQVVSPEYCSIDPNISSLVCEQRRNGMKHTLGQFQDILQDVFSTDLAPNASLNCTPGSTKMPTNINGTLYKHYPIYASYYGNLVELPLNESYPVMSPYAIFRNLSWLSTTNQTYYYCKNSSNMFQKITELDGCENFTLLKSEYPEMPEEVPLPSRDSCKCVLSSSNKACDGVLNLFLKIQVWRPTKPGTTVPTTRAPKPKPKPNRPVRFLDVSHQPFTNGQVNRSENPSSRFPCFHGNITMQIPESEVYKCTGTNIVRFHTYDENAGRKTPITETLPCILHPYPMEGGRYFDCFGNELTQKYDSCGMLPFGFGVQNVPLNKTSIESIYDERDVLECWDYHQYYYNFTVKDERKKYIIILPPFGLEPARNARPPFGGRPFGIGDKRWFPCGLPRWIAYFICRDPEQTKSSEAPGKPTIQDIRKYVEKEILSPEFDSDERKALNGGGNGRRGVDCVASESSNNVIFSYELNSLGGFRHNYHSYEAVSLKDEIVLDRMPIAVLPYEPFTYAPFFHPMFLGEKLLNKSSLVLCNGNNLMYQTPLIYDYCGSLQFEIHRNFPPHPRGDGNNCFYGEHCDSNCAFSKWKRENMPVPTNMFEDNNTIPTN